MAAFRRARKMGADGVELDVRRTADDRLVVHHDPSLADGRPIRATASSELPAWLPTLADALDACDGMFVNIEIKNDPGEGDFDPTEWVANSTIAELTKRKTNRRWLISSFRFETVAACRRSMPSISTAWLVYRPSDAAIERTASAGHMAIHPRVDLVTEGSVRRAHAAGLAVNPWTCDDPDRMRELIAWGVDGICTNTPDVAARVRSGRSD